MSFPVAPAICWQPKENDRARCAAKPVTISQPETSMECRYAKDETARRSLAKAWKITHLMERQVHFVVGGEWGSQPANQAWALGGRWDKGSKGWCALY